MTPRLARLTIYPIKSLDGVDLDAGDILPSGALRDDRRYAIADPAGQFFHGKRDARIHRLAATFDLVRREVTLAVRDAGSAGATFHLDDDRPRLDAWLSEHFGTKLHIVEDSERGMPDDTQAPGPTIVSTATLATVAEWFSPTTVDDARRRFRANLEIDGVPAFWEDRLVPGENGTVRLAVGEVVFEGTGVCQRCVVPSRHPETGDVIAGFAKEFSRQRQESLPDWAPRWAFDHYYRLTINTRLAPVSGGGRLRLGDELRLLN